MSTAQVAQALNRSRAFLAASNLNPGVLRGERPSKAIALINPHQQDVKDYLGAAFRSPDRTNNPLMLFSRFKPEQVRLVGDQVRTRGRMTFREGDDRALRVTADVTFVYPLARSAGGDEVARTIVRREVVVDWDNPTKVLTQPGTLSLVSYPVHTANGGCGPVTGYFAPQFSAELAVFGDGPRVDSYDRSTPMTERLRQPQRQECETATRS
ncbi:hypothetical protein [Streptomyces sp. NPDC020965]|uniref:hypothetical protein n=1 Tax=Streptomyces sp. NPDC020965 TaxID=3365105 RepID=UPI00378A702F